MTIKFLKKLYEQRFKDITVILLDDSKPGEDNSYNIRPYKFFFVSGVVCLFISILFLVFIINTLGSFFQTSEEALIRSEIEAIAEKVLRVQDSLNIRDQQLSEMKHIIRMSFDTTLTIDQRFNSVLETGAFFEESFSFGNKLTAISNKVSPSGIVVSNILNSGDHFPSRYPVHGTLTRDFDPDNLHFGIDIATSNNQLISNVADGTVISSTWTFNDGYVLAIQHAGGIVCVYKHLLSVTKKSGDIVIKGDILGSVGDVGLSSSGPHLHFEIWKDGDIQDPALYLIK